jgi:hypothetical protein
MEFDEQALILQCQHGDKSAFGLLAKKYLQGAYHIALGLTGAHESALDLSQEANAIVDVRFSTSYIMGAASEILVVGTAVVIE